MKDRITVVALILALLIVVLPAHADMGFHPEASFSITLDGRPFNSAMVSMQECQEYKRYSSSDYSIAVMGRNLIFQDDNLIYNILQTNEEWQYYGREEIESFYGYTISWNDEQLNLARKFVLDEFDELNQCYWQPSERSFTDCENSTCSVTYRVPALFRIKVLDLDTGKTYITWEISRKGLNTKFSVDFESSSGIGSILPLTENTLKPTSINNFFPIFIINILIELLAAIILSYFAFKIKIKKIIIPILLGNLITHPIAYFIPQLFSFESAFMVALGMDIIILATEAFAVLFEALLMLKIAKIKWVHAIWISFIINLISLFIGAFIPL